MRSIFLIYLMGFVNAFARFGRYADLILGVVMLSLAVVWRSPWTGVFGCISLAAYAFDVNGRIQRGAISFARSRVAVRPSPRPPVAVASRDPARQNSWK